jgi:hypothetical protein
MAGSTRLELATSGVTGRRSNQLNYDPKNQDGKHEDGETGNESELPLACVTTFPAPVVAFRPSCLPYFPSSRLPRVGGKGFEPLTAGV